MKLLHLYPDLMNLYGDWGNLAVLKRTLEAMGETVSITHDVAELSSADLVYMGAGTENATVYVLEQLRPLGADLRLSAKTGLPMVFCGTALDVVCTALTDGAGVTHPGLGLVDCTVTHTNRRQVKDVVGTSPRIAQAVVGYRNTCSVIAGNPSPFLTALSLGSGGCEGVFQGNVLATQLTGPLLVKNPAVLDWVITTLFQRQGRDCPPIPQNPHAVAGHAVTLSQLAQI